MNTLVLHTSESNLCQDSEDKSSLEVPDICVTGPVTKFHKRAFENHYNLQSITIPFTISEISDYVFSGCTNLTYFAFSFDDRLNVSLDSTRLVKIGKRAFYHCCSLKSFVIPGSVEEIGEEAFRGCYSIVSFTFAKKKKERNCTGALSLCTRERLIIHHNAFHDCRELMNISLPENTKWVGAQMNFPFHNSFYLKGYLESFSSESHAWLEQRFNNLPLHQVCYDSDVTLERIRSAISLACNNDMVKAVDDVGMTAMHTLVCNPFASSLMMKEVAHVNSMVDQMVCKAKCTAGLTPLDLYLEVNNLRTNLLHSNFPLSDSPISIWKLLETGDQLQWRHIESIIAIQNSTEEQYLQHVDTGLYPFMMAACLAQCNLEKVFHLALKVDFQQLCEKSSGKKRDYFGDLYVVREKRPKVK